MVHRLVLTMRAGRQALLSRLSIPALASRWSKVCGLMTLCELFADLSVRCRRKQRSSGAIGVVFSSEGQLRSAGELAKATTG